MNVRGALRRRLLAVGGTLTGVSTEVPAVALTFDDGPDPIATPRILNVLATHGARATFFVVGRLAAESPDLLARITEEGHTLANHTWSHASLPRLSGRKRREEIRRAASIVGRGADLFRPPFGHQTWTSRIDTLRTGHDVVAWGRHIWDWEAHDSSFFEIHLEEALGPGRIILLHDGLCDAPDPRASDRTAVTRALDAVLARATPQFRFVTVPELLQLGKPNRSFWTWTGGGPEE